MVIAVPSILQQSFISIGNILIQSVINGFGASVMAGYSAAVKLNNLVITSFTTIGNGISNFAAQNLGAGKYSRLKDGFRAGIKMVWCLCIPFWRPLYFSRKIFAPFVHGRRRGSGYADGTAISVDSVAVLFCLYPPS